MATSPHTIDVGPLLSSGRRTIAVDSQVGVPDSGDIRFAKPAHVVLELSGVERGVRIAGTIDADVVAECNRCLEEVAIPLHLEVDEQIARDQDGLDPLSENNVLTGERLDLADLVRQLTTTALPMGVLCAEDCRGLCPHCGLNRNQGGCSCPAETESEHGEP